MFRGNFRLKIRFQAMKSVSVARGVLRVNFPEGTARFELGPQAESWAQRILHPKSLMDKLGVKPGVVVAVRGVRDASFRKQLDEQTAEVAHTRPRKDSDFIFLAAEARADLKRVGNLSLTVAAVPNAGRCLSTI